MKKCVVILALVLAGCVSSGVVPMDRDTYTISKRSAQLGFGPPEGTRADVYQEANEFCRKQNKQVETVRLRMTNSDFAQPGSVALQFRCVAADVAVERKEPPRNLLK